MRLSLESKLTREARQQRLEEQQARREAIQQKLEQRQQQIEFDSITFGFERLYTVTKGVCNLNPEHEDICQELVDRLTNYVEDYCIINAGDYKFCGEDVSREVFIKPVIVDNPTTPNSASVPEASLTAIPMFILAGISILLKKYKNSYKDYRK